MYMQPIVAAKPLPSLARRRLVGSTLLLLGMIAMLPWLALCGTIAATAFGLRALLALPRTVRDAIDHVGDYAHGL